MLWIFAYVYGFLQHASVFIGIYKAQHMTKTAIVTGATNGMGREFARILDKNEQLDEIWCIGRNVANLDALADELTTPVRKFAVDLTDGGVQIVVDAAREAQPDVAWLINAAGFGKFGRYDEIPVEQSLNMVRLNCECLVAMTEYLLPFMYEGAKIAEFSSVAAFQPTPYQNVYAATKAFVHSYARALNMELAPRKILVTAVCPFWTESGFFDRCGQTERKVVTKFAAIYKAYDVSLHAYKDMKKGKDFSMHGFKARMQTRAVKFMPVRFVMNTWIKQQGFDKKYK